MKNINLLFGFLAVVTCFIFLLFAVDVYLLISKHLYYIKSNDMYELLDSLKITNINANNIPSEIKDKIFIFNAGNIKQLKSKKEKCKKIISELCNKTNKLECNSIDDFIFFDVIDSTGGYFPSLHTDIEWNKIQNDGFNVWSLEYNKNEKKIGNMFLLVNPYLQKKYENTAIYIRFSKDIIHIYKNCVNASREYFGLSVDDYLLDTMTKEDFIKTSRMYYLDFKEGDTIVFDKNIMHMSDYRDTSHNRKAFNFRVAIKDKDKNIVLDDDDCGFSLSIKEKKLIENPSKYEFV
jgi:hypothetical protein